MEKLNCNSLMIGDWVRTEAGALIVAGVGHKIYCRANDGNPTHLWEVTSIEPIPLTPEILEKNGFIYNEIPFVQGWEQYGLTLTAGGDGFRVSCGQNTSMIIDFVHELQHALRLCGIEHNIMV